MWLIDPDTRAAYPDMGVAYPDPHVAPSLLLLVLYIVLISK